MLAIAVRTPHVPAAAARVLAKCMSAAFVSSLYVAGLFFHLYLRSHADDLGRPTVSVGPLESVVFHGIPGVWLQAWTPDWSAIEWLAILTHGSWFLLLAFPFVVCIRSGAKAAAQMLGGEQLGR